MCSQFVGKGPTVWRVHAHQLNPTLQKEAKKKLPQWGDQPGSKQVKAERMERQLYYSVIQCPTGARLHFLSNTKDFATVLVLATKLVLATMLVLQCLC